MPAYDAIVVGCGGVGSAALLALARRGVRAIGIDPFPPGHDRGSSHGETRVIRQAYFEHPDYVPLARRAYALWDELEQATGKRLFERVGVLQVGPPDGEVVPGVLKAARLHGLAVHALSAEECRWRFPLFAVDDSEVAVFEANAGFLHVERCVRAQAAEAVRLGAELRVGVSVLRFIPVGTGVQVHTPTGTFEAPRLIVTAGAWTKTLLGDDLSQTGSPAVRLTVLRQPVAWFASTTDRTRADRGCPCFLFESSAGVHYGTPALADGAVKWAEHGRGEAVVDPTNVDRAWRRSDEEAVAAVAARRMPAVAAGRLVRSSVCLYTMSSDGHFLVDRLPWAPQVVFAAGLSGHGFKFASALGEALAEVACGDATTVPIGFLGLGRFGAAAS